MFFSITNKSVVQLLHLRTNLFTLKYAKASCEPVDPAKMRHHGFFSTRSSSRSCGYKWRRRSEFAMPDAFPLECISQYNDKIWLCLVCYWSKRRDHGAPGNGFTYDQMIIWSCDHMAIWSCDHMFIWSYDHYDGCWVLRTESSTDKTKQNDVLKSIPRHPLANVPISFVCSMLALLRPDSGTYKSGKLSSEAKNACGGPKRQFLNMRSIVWSERG